MNVLGIDIGGSALKGAPVNTLTGELLAERHRIATPDTLSPKEMAASVGELARHFRWRGPIGVGFPGVVHGTRILTAANLHKGFVGCDAGKLFAGATRCRVAVTNDAAAAAMAEMRFGAGEGFDGKVLILTLGTGVGSAVAFGGVVVPFELGHLPWKGKDAEKHVAASVREQKDLTWKEWGGRLHHYVAILERVIWPELIIVGGGVSSKHHKFFKYIKPRARLVPAEFFNEAGIVGAALAATAVHARKR
ncbi:ROK family protein [Opitutus sp. ER46]|uniref:polyphosphate--glucose phosphotransferase n=1 Tax=Opitutus sp. ER46 TaxID=2161864 RepID=UPI000D3247AD|nr:ROK family protein [Opitutus sp. ER46]PTX91795.1 polyphosphate glucokinase [Opitutus sp. ER46]